MARTVIPVPSVRFYPLVDIHKPKPWHGVREFLKEYVIIVVGVLTALAAEQGVEWLHWRHLVGQAREAVAKDQRTSMEWVGGVDRISPCMEARLDEIRVALNTAAETGRIPAELPNLANPPSYPWAMRGWDGVVSGQVLSHLSPEESGRYSAQASAEAFLRSVSKEMSDDWSVLRSLDPPGRRLNDAEEANLRATLARIYFQAARIRQNADHLGRQFLGSGPLRKDQIAAAWKHGFDTAASQPVCEARPVEPGLSIPWLLRPSGPPQQPYDPWNYR